MGLRRTATIQEPHATYESGDWTWKVLKVNAPKQPLDTHYISWFCAVQSPMTYGGWDMGDTYVTDVVNYATLVSATDEFKAYLKGDA